LGNNTNIAEIRQYTWKNSVAIHQTEGFALSGSSKKVNI